MFKGSYLFYFGRASLFKMGKKRLGKNVNKRNNKRNPKRNQDSLTRLIPKYPGDPVLEMLIPGEPIPLPIPAGIPPVSAVSSALSAAGIDNFTARFGTWDEYRIVSVLVRFRTVSVTYVSGIVVAWFEANTNATVPNFANSVSNRTKVFPMADPAQSHSMVYKPYDVADLNYRTTTGAQIIGYLNMYSDLPNYGAQTSLLATSPILIAMPVYRVQFRGLA